MTVFEYAGRLLIVDCGVLFPEDNQPGVDLVLPDFDYIRVAPGRHRGDRPHARPRGPHRRGAVPAARTSGHPAGRLPADPGAWSRRSCASTGSSRCSSRSEEGQVERLGPFEAEFVAVNHSIPDALAVALRTPSGQLVLHTGDFKMDQLPLDGRITDLRAFARLGEEGVDLFLVDSTNAEVPGFVPPERRIEPVIDAVFTRAERRVIAACFASHVHRVQQILDVAARHGRKVAFIGRSMVRNMGVARDLGYLTIPAGLVVGGRRAGPPARRAGRARLHRLAGRADGGAVPDGEQRPPDPGRRGRHRAARVVADPGQRERRLPGHQRPVPARRATWCTRATRSCTSPGTRPRAS